MNELYPMVRDRLDRFCHPDDLGTCNELLRQDFVSDADFNDVSERLLWEALRKIEESPTPDGFTIHHVDIELNIRLRICFEVCLLTKTYSSMPAAYTLKRTDPGRYSATYECGLRDKNAKLVHRGPSLCHYENPFPKEPEPWLIRVTQEYGQTSPPISLRKWMPRRK